MRTWGFALGITIAQFVINGFSKPDAFMSGMLTGQLIMFLSVPVTFLIAWAVFSRTRDECVKCICIVIFLGLCVFELVAFLPFAVTLTAFATEMMIKHSVIVYIAIPIDYFTFLALLKPTAEDLAALGLAQVGLRAMNLLSMVGVQQSLPVSGTQQSLLQG